MARPPDQLFMWKNALKRHSRFNPAFSCVQDLADAVSGYFDYVQSCPLKEQKHFAYKGTVTTVDVDKMRAMSLRGVFTYCGITRAQWDNYRALGGQWEALCDTVEDIIYSQKFEGAAAGLLNSTIVARDLGLSDGVEVSGPGGAPIEQKIEQRTNLSSLNVDQLELLEAALKNPEKVLAATKRTAEDE